MLSVSLYDIVISALGGDSVHARQAIVNAMVLAAVASAGVVVVSVVRCRAATQG